MILRVARNTLFLSVSQIIARVMGFFYFIFLARALGVETFGIYNFTLAFIYNFVPVADFGIERLVLRDIPRKPRKTSFYFSRLLPLRVVLATAAYFTALVLGLILGQPLRQIFYLAILGLALFPYSLIYLIASFQNAREKMEYMAGASIASPVLTIIFGVPFVLAKLPLIFVFLAIVLANNLVALFFLKKVSSWNLNLGWIVDKNFWRYILSQSWVFAALTILAIFYLRTTIILVGILKGNYFTGLYGSAFKFIEAMILIPQSLALALFPLSSRLFLADKNRLLRIYKKGMIILFLLSLPFVSVLSGFPNLVVSLAYGQRYLEAVPVLRILGFSLILFFINALAGNIIQNSPQVKQFLWVIFFKLVLGIVLGLILIPSHSILGAAWALVGAEFFGVIANNWFIWRILR